MGTKHQVISPPWLVPYIQTPVLQNAGAYGLWDQRPVQPESILWLAQGCSAAYHRGGAESWGWDWRRSFTACSRLPAWPWGDITIWTVISSSSKEMHFLYLVHLPTASNPMNNVWYVPPIPAPWVLLSLKTFFLLHWDLLEIEEGGPVAPLPWRSGVT